MKTQEFLELLKENQNKSLLFDYKNGALVGANYHITEVKNISIDAVDCGARRDSSLGFGVDLRRFRGSGGHVATGKSQVKQNSRRRWRNATIPH